jgi:peptidoglycan/xylan/chitin deacetylase (PgdA/CDA1 family)
MADSLFDRFEFALCLTHDVDRPYKTFQAPYDAVKERDLSPLKPLVTSEQPYWQFEEIMELEEELGVRSSFYFLNEKQLLRDKSPRAWLRPINWIRYNGHYRIDDPDIIDVIQALDEGGWEVGLHGSYDSYAEKERLRYEKEELERVLGHSIKGGRQHYLNLNQPETWQYQRDIGLQYDTSLGSSIEYGFQHGYDVRRPFDDEFVVFPLTIMDVSLIKKNSNLEKVKTKIYSLLREAKDNNATMTILWHPRLFNQDEFPKHHEIYRYIIKKAQEMDAWIGPVGELYTELEKKTKSRY